MEGFKIISKSKLNELPKTTGVYSFFTKKLNPKPYTLNPIYIGKAVNIINRVKNHFNQPSYRDNLFIDKVDKIGYFETGSEIEALVLEANLIKKYQPKFNVVWRDDKNYFYVAIAQNPSTSSGQVKQKIPYVFITHQPKADRLPMSIQLDRHRKSANSIGPFVEGAALKKTLRFLRRVFPYYTSARHPKNKCTYCHLDLCPGPELFENPPSPKASEGLREYRRNIKKLVLILKGKRGAVLKSLRKEMKKMSKEQNFEKAGKLRDQIYALQQVMAHTYIINDTKNDAINLSSKLTIVNFNDNRTWPKTEKILQKILWPSLRGEQSLNRIECYDVSNIQGKLATGSMVVFTDGKPDKSQYRKFKIKIENTPNDIAMLKEVLERRFSHPEWKYPDVILIDGGKAQLNIAIKTKKKLDAFKNLDTLYSRSYVQGIRVMAVTKGKQELFIEGRQNPIPLKSLPQEVYNLVKQLDDEAHRFAITYHKTLRKKELLG